MDKVEYINGYNEFRAFVNDLKCDRINFYFTGSKNESGKSWCGDCVEAAPHIQNAIEKYGNNSTILHVDVGDRAFWKDMKNPFRIDKDIHLMVIPTLIRWKKPQRLEGDQCANDELLEMFFEEEE